MLRKMHKNPEASKRVLTRIKELMDTDEKTVKSKKFRKFMERLIKEYSEGGWGLKLPHFVPKNFAYLVISKFRSYDLRATLVYDYEKNLVFFSDL